MREGERGPADPIDVFTSGVRVGGNKMATGEGFHPVGLLGKGDEVVDLVDAFLTGKSAERSPLVRGNTESSCTLHLGVSVSAFPHLKLTAAA